MVVHGWNAAFLREYCAHASGLGGCQTFKAMLNRRQKAVIARLSAMAPRVCVSFQCKYNSWTDVSGGIPYASRCSCRKNSNTILHMCILSCEHKQWTPIAYSETWYVGAPPRSCFLHGAAFARYLAVWAAANNLRTPPLSSENLKLEYSKTAVRSMSP